MVSTIMQQLITKALKVCQVSDFNGRSYKQVCAKSIVYQHLHSRGYSLHSIARMFGKNHSSVHNILKKYDDRLEYDNEFRMLVERFNSYGNQG